MEIQFVIFFLMYGQSTRWDSSHGDSEPAETEGVFSRRDSERIMMEYSHGDTASVQRMAREPCHVETAEG